MTVPGLGILLTNSSRSRAYLQKLISNGLLPEHLFLLRIDKPNKADALNSDSPLSGVLLKAWKTRKYFLYSGGPHSILPKPNTPPKLFASFDPAESIEDTLKKHNLKSIVLSGTSLNDDSIIRQISSSACRYIIFCGGGILRTEILNCGPRFIHVHPGHVPFVRGSMAIEWSVLTRPCCAVSAIFMAEGIDCGDLIDVMEFPFPPLENNSVPALFSPHMRSELLVRVIRALSDSGDIKSNMQANTGAQTFYKMHPALHNLVFHKLDQQPPGDTK